MNTRLRTLTTLAAAFALSLGQAAANSADSSNVRVDTRDLSLGGLVIEGPATIAALQKTPYSAMLDGVEVTAQCDWPLPKCSRTFDGWWSAPSISGLGMLDPHGAQPGDTIDITASFLEPGGDRRQVVKRITIASGAGLYFGIDRHIAYLGPVGSQFDWKVNAGVSGTAANQAGVTFTWYLNNVVQGTGKTIERTIRGFPTTSTLRVVASDGQGKSGEQSVTLGLLAPAPGEPGQRYDVWRKSGVSFLNPAGDPTEPDPAKKNNGVIVLTHGIWSYPEVTWILNLAREIETKLAGPGQPNILIFGWGEDANPGDLYGSDPERLQTVASSIGLSAAALRQVFPDSTARTAFLFDTLMIREVAKDKGRSSLAKWCREQEGYGNISKAAPIHLIGHSAGGFVMGECYTELNKFGFNIRRVTMLDTPFAQKQHVNAGNPAVVERYVSSLFGRFSEVDPVRYNPLIGLYFSEKPDSTWYHRLDVGGWWDTWSPTRAMDSHGYSHDWYDETVPSYGEQEGFQLSPFVTGAPSQAPPSGDPQSDPIPRDNGGPERAPQPPTQLDGFTTFGGVTGTGTPFVLTENGNAGIVKAMTLPPDASGLTFQYQFTSPGDGDFLVVFFGDSPPLFVASPTGSNTAGEATAEVSLAPYAGKTGNLVIKLVAQEAANAVVTVGNIQMTLDDDLDGDGILAAAEVAAGTDPRLADTDGDGIDDPTELNTTHTNPTVADTDGDGADDGSELVAGTDPLDGSSRFAVKSAVKVGVDFSITWASIAGKHYRIIRSAEPSFAGFDVVASGIAASPPLQSYTDSGGVTESRMFYRVELDQ